MIGKRVFVWLEAEVGDAVTRLGASRKVGDSGAQHWSCLHALWATQTMHTSTHTCSEGRTVENENPDEG